MFPFRRVPTIAHHVVVALLSQLLEIDELLVSQELCRQGGSLVNTFRLTDALQKTKRDDSLFHNFTFISCLIMEIMIMDLT